MSEIKLTQYSHGSGCGCKISPKILEGIISTATASSNSHLLVGNSTRDDAAVYDIGNGQAIISTTDFFMPIVDDPHDFGAIAATNALSDIYAMGGRPLMAIAILGWPVDKIDSAIAGKVLEGGRNACRRAGIEVAGGHSIDNPEPVYGLAVTGIIRKENLKKNNTGQEHALLYLTKPLGVGLITTAQKKGLVKQEDISAAQKSMLTLNDAGMQFSKLPYVEALTDVTGFGLLGHLTEMCEGSNLSSEIYFNAVPRFNNIDYYISKNLSPGGTQRNWESYGSKIGPITEDQKALLADPQTSGGLLVAIEPHNEQQFMEFSNKLGLGLKPIGKLIQEKEKRIYIN